MHFDVIIIGTGAGGGTLLHRLAPTGKSILVLERGGWIPREKDNWDTKAALHEGKYKTHETWRDGNGREFGPSTHYAVGGNTKVYGAALLRLRERDFGELKHHGGVSPAWPLDHKDFDGFYTRAENLYLVHGTRGEDPTEPPCADPFPHPAVSHEPRIAELSADLARQGLKPFHLPLGIKLNEQDRINSECVRCATCDGFPCLVNAKCDAQVIGVMPSLKYPNVTLWTEAMAEKLETSADGRSVTGVQVARKGEKLRVSADIVVVSCGAINSAALLLRSRNEKHPDGLANGSGQVGRNYMCHNNSAVLAISKRENPTVFQKTLALTDWYFESKDWEHPMGLVQMLGKSDKDLLAIEAPPVAPGMALDQMARHSIDFWLTSEDLPDPENRVTIDPDGRIRLSYKPNNEEAHKRLFKMLKKAVNAAGCEDGSLFCQSLYLGKRIPIAGVAHQCGTTRFGRDPKASVLDVNCRAHEVDNLYVVDGGFFVSSTAVNPALTIMANALRVGDHLAERMNGQ